MTTATSNLTRVSLFSIAIYATRDDEVRKDYGEFLRDRHTGTADQSTFDIDDTSVPESADRAPADKSVMLDPECVVRVDDVDDATVEDIDAADDDDVTHERPLSRDDTRQSDDAAYVRLNDASEKSARDFGSFLQSFNHGNRDKSTMGDDPMDVTMETENDACEMTAESSCSQQTHLCSDFNDHSLQYLFDRQLWKYVNERMRSGSADLDISQSARRKSKSKSNPTTCFDPSVFKPTFWFVINHKHHVPHSYQSLLSLCSDVILCSVERLHETVMYMEMLYMLDQCNVMVFFSNMEQGPDKKKYKKFIEKNFVTSGF